MVLARPGIYTDAEHGAWKSAVGKRTS